MRAAKLQRRRKLRQRLSQKHLIGRRHALRGQCRRHLDRIGRDHIPRLLGNRDQITKLRPKQSQTAPFPIRQVIAVQNRIQLRGQRLQVGDVRGKDGSPRTTAQAQASSLSLFAYSYRYHSNPKAVDTIL